MTNVITSVSDYLEKLKTIAVDEDSQLFYRGVSNEEYATPENNIPSIYRNQGWIENENKMFSELVSRVPEEFKDCRNTFEYLVKMQHYGYPTRLLDITSNPLVALYFACTGDMDKNGAIIPLSIKKADICNFESDRIALVTTLALSKRTISLDSFIINNIRTILFEKSNVMSNPLDFYKSYWDDDTVHNSGFCFVELSEIITLFDEIIPLVEIWVDSFNKVKTNNWQIECLFNHVEDIIDSLLQVDKEYSDLVGFQRLVSLKQKIVSQQFSKGVLCPPAKSTCGAIPNVSVTFYKLIKHIGKIAENLCKNDIELNSFNYDIKKWRPHFNTNLIEASDMYGIHCVLPKQNNPRILAQKGAFLLFGFNESSSSITTKPKINDSSLIEKNMLFIIPNDKKQRLLEELFRLGISESTLFPEIDYVTKELKKEYEIPKVKNIKYKM